MKPILKSRREFIVSSLKKASLVVASTGVGTGLTGCKGGSTKGKFEYGVASGDPLTDRVILWTRVTPLENKNEIAKDRYNTQNDNVWVAWQVATDKDFKNVVNFDAAQTSVANDFTIKVDVQGLMPGTTYYYRFLTTTHKSVVGKTKTLPEGSVDSAKFAVVSCSNYPAGYFHTYREVAKIEDLDAVIHLGDYLYEYPRGGYASENAAMLNRDVMPAHELISLDDYRQRYAQYRTDPDLQAAHASAPFIAVWDDHEIANDTWREGAENHNEGEGDFFDRLMAALKAYAEWMPIRPPVEEDISALQRNFQYGDLVNLSMLDTRLVGRDQQLNLVNYFDAQGNFNVEAYTADIADPNRTLLGADQLYWLQGQLAVPTTWQVLGQQVLMGTMELPTAVATQQLSIAEFATLAQLAQIAATNPELLTPEQLTLVQTQGYLLQLGSLPYNLDAWDGYPVERATVLATAQQYNTNLVVLAGDTHNAWANNLNFNGAPAGIEFATPSVSSPGLEDYLGLDSEQAVLQTEAGVTQLISGLQYCNLADRGFMVVEFNHQTVNCHWHFVSSIIDEDYTQLVERNYTVSANAGELKI